MPESRAGTSAPPAALHSASGGSALLTDLYELTMLQAYWREGLMDPAVFTLFVRRLPRRRNFLLACGLESVLDYLETLRFDAAALDVLARRGEFSDAFVSWLADFRFTGSVRAIPEGTPFFANEPILEVTAPLPEAQLVETFILNQVHVQTLLASKAARVVRAARGRSVVDFGLRKAHGADAGVKAARAFYIAGVDATSNVLAGSAFGVPLAGTMAHSYVQAHDDELEAFREFAALYPETVLLVDTYDALEGVRLVVRVARELGDAFRVRAVRIDSGDLLEVSRAARAILDEAGLHRVDIFASSQLDEYEIGRLVEMGAPIAGFGVGSSMSVSADAPALDMVYKLVEYAGAGRVKLSPEKPVLPGAKQVFRVAAGDTAVRDVIARADEGMEGRALLSEVMRSGRRVEASPSLESVRDHARREMARLPDAVLAIDAAEPPFPVTVSDALLRRQREDSRRATGG